MNINYRNYLTQNILPFWISNAIDKKNGGIYTCLNTDGNLYDKTKSVWFQGRALWTFAVAYNTVENKKEYLDVCENLYGFILKCADSAGRLPYTVTSDGKPLVKRDYYYSEAFAAIGCAQYYKACKKEEVWQSAEKFFDICNELYMNPLTRSVEMVREKDPHKVFGVSMIMLSTAQFMRNVGINTEKYDAVASYAIDEMRNGGYINDDLKSIIDHVDLDGNFTNTSMGTMLFPGHAYEAAWFVLLEGEIKNDDSIRKLGKKILDYSMPDGYYDNSCFVPTFRIIGKSPYEDLDRLGYRWWPQNEAIIAYALAYNIFKEEKYRHLFEKIMTNAMEHFADKESNEWFAYVDYGTHIPQKIKGDSMKGPFHLPRMLMALISIDETGSILKYIS